MQLGTASSDKSLDLPELDYQGPFFVAHKQMGLFLNIETLMGGWCESVCRL